MRHAQLKHLFGIFTVCCALVLVGCEAETEVEEIEDTTTEMDATEGMGQQTAVAQISPTEGNSARGSVTFTSMNGEVRVEGEIMGLSEGMHGFHVHENGECGPDGEAAGGHFAPNASPHGGPDDAPDQRHVGDLGNIQAGSDSTATIMMTDSLLTLTGPNSIVGKALVVHAGEDDLESQPSGDSGPRVGCGIIEMQGGGMMNDTTGAMGGMTDDTTTMGGM